MAGDASAVIWMADPRHLGVWNGADVATSPPLVDLSAYTMGGAMPQELLLTAEASIASRNIGGADQHLAVVPIGSTATPPTGQVLLVRWATPTPAVGDRTDAYIPSAVSVHVLDLGAGAHLNPDAGTAIATIDDATAMVAYQEGGTVFIRPVALVAPSGGGVIENPPTLPAIRLGAGESVLALSLDGGAYVIDASSFIGRIAVAALIEKSDGSRQIRTRALEACIGPP
jgi:hypothetical protein